MQSYDKIWNFLVRNWLVSLKINMPQEKGSIPISKVFVFRECEDQWECDSEFLKGVLYFRFCAYAESKEDNSLPRQGLGLLGMIYDCLF